MFKPTQWVNRLVALCALVTGSAFAAADESAPGYDPNPTIIHFEMKLGVVEAPRVSKRMPWTEDEKPERDDFRAVYDPTPFVSTKPGVMDTGGLFSTDAPTLTVPGFEGAAANTGALPPDPTLAVGPSDLAIGVNTALTIRNLAGTLLSSQTFASLLPTTQFLSDPNIEYDPYSGRFVGCIISVDNTSTFANARWWVFYSDDSTALGSWSAIALNARQNGATDTNIWADYPHIALTNDAICVSAIMFPTPSGSGDSFGKLRFIDKSDLYDGGGITWLDFWSISSDGTPDKRPVPCTSWGSPSRFYVVSAKEGGAGNITVREFDDTAGGNNGAQTTLIGTYVVPVSTYAVPPDCRQPGGVTPLDNIDCRILQAEIGNGVSSLYAVHTTARSEGAINGSAIKAYRLNLVPNQAPTVELDSTQFLTGFDYFYPGITATEEGAAIITFNRSGSTENCGVRQTGFKYGGTVIEGTSAVKAGLGTYSRVASGRNRWGDYNCCALNPVDRNTVWFHGEYATAANNWGTWVAAAKYNAYYRVETAPATIPTSGTGTISATVRNSDTAVASAGVNVTFFVNGASVGTAVTNASGVASRSYTVPSGTVPGTLPLQAVASAGSLETGEETDTLTVTKANTACQVTNEAGVPGQTVNFTAQLIRTTDSAGLSGKTINFTVNGVGIGSAITDATGFANINYVITNNAGGSYPVGISFAGDALYNVSSASSSLSVTKAATVLTLSSGNGLPGNNVSLTATLRRTSDNAVLSSKPVAISVNSVLVGTPVTNGVGIATVNYVVPNIAPAALVSNAAFAGDTNYLASNINSTFTVQSGSLISVNSPSNYRTFSVTFTATLRRSFDNAAQVGKTVNFVVDGVGAGSAVTNASGNASINYVIPAAATIGNGHTVTATFSGDALQTSATTANSWTVFSPDIIGTVTFLDYVGPYTSQNVVLTVRNSADVIVQGPQTLSLTAGGFWQAVTSLPAGVYKVSIKGPHWLRKQTQNVTINTTLGSTISVNQSLLNGDCAPDNVIDLSDYTAVATAFNALPSSPNWNAAADLNGDLIVDLTDYTIVAVNFNAIGDN